MDPQSTSLFHSSKSKLCQINWNWWKGIFWFQQQTKLNKQKNLAFSYNHRKLTQMTNTDKAKIMLSSNNKNKDSKCISQLLQGGRQTQTAVVQLQRESRVVISHVVSGCLLTPMQSMPISAEHSLITLLQRKERIWHLTHLQKQREVCLG